MLDLLRRKAQSKVIQATIIIIILVFIFWGVGTNQGTGTNAVATVNGESIIYSDYQKEYDGMVTRLRDQFGGTIPKGLLEATNFKQQVINQLIQTTLMRQGAQEIGLYVSDTELRRAIEDMEAFKNNGAFDVQWYEEVLAGSRMTVSTFEEGLRYDLLSAKIIDHLKRFGQVSESELMELYKYNYDQVNLQYAEFSAEQFKEKVEVSNEDIKAFFDKNRETYQSLPEIKIKYISIPFSGKNLTADIEEDVLLQNYKDNIVRYTNPEKRHARHILIRSAESDSPEQIAAKRETITEILAKANSGEDFAELAKEFSEDGSASRGGDLGFFSRGQMVKPFEDAAFSLTEGGVSEIVQTQFGFHIIKLEAVQASGVTPFEEVKAEIAASLQTETGKTLAFQKANETYEKIILSGSIDKYAASLTAEGETASSPINETDYFSQQEPPTDLRTNPALVNSAFTLKNGELSSIIETGDGYAIVYVKDRKEPAQQELSAVQDKVQEDFINEKAVELAKDAAKQFLSKLKEGADFSSEADNLQAVVDSTGLVSRADSTASKLPPQVLQDNLNLSESAPYCKEIADQGNSFYVVAFKEKEAADQDKIAEQKDALSGQLAGEKANGLLAAWAGYLREDADITINDSLL